MLGRLGPAQELLAERFVASGGTAISMDVGEGGIPVKIRYKPAAA